jgi:CRISPR-associated protein Csb2
MPTLPADYLAAISISTSDLQAAGWSQPPGAQMLRYVRQSGALRPRPRPKRAPARRVDTVRYLLVAKPLPRIEDALRLGENMRQAAMGLAKTILGADDVPAELSGHGTTEGRNHQHSFYLAEDADHDGRIDHVIVHSPGSFSEQALGVLERLRHVRSTEGVAWTLVLELTGERASRSVPSSLLASADVWVSVTPYLHPWHLKKNLDTAGQVRRESLARGWPTPIEIEPLPVLRLRGRALRTLQFRRFRSKRGLVQPDTHGSFLRIRFAEPVAGPIALGFGCHFGLGLFRPASD